MNPRALIGIAVGLAGLVFVMILWLPGQPSSEPGSTIAPPDATELPGGLNQVNPDATRFVPTAQRYEYHFEQSGRRIDVFGDTLSPQPDGIAELGRPDVRIHLSDHSILQITSDAGTFVAPENHLRSGHLNGHVLIQLYETVDRAPDLSDTSPDRVLRMDLDEALFDLELGQIESDGRVSVVGERIEYLGRGLTLAYNEKHRRVDRLEIAHGQHMKIQLEAEGHKTPSLGPSQRADAVDIAKSQATPQFYLARFENKVQLSGKQMDLKGDQLELILSLDAERGRPAGHPATGDDQFGPQQLQKDENTIIIKWTGRMVVVPEDQPPSELSGSGDMLATMVGRPVQLVTKRQETVTAARAEYLYSTGQLRMAGTGVYPLKLDARKLGVLEGQSLQIDQTAGVGHLLGPGSFRAHGRSAGEPRNLGIPPGLAVYWQQRLDLAFYRLEGRDASDDQTTLIRALRQIDVRGDVQVDDPNFHLNSDSLTLLFRDPNVQESVLRTIRAEGHVHVDTPAVEQQPAMAIQSDQFQVDLEPTMTPTGFRDVQPIRLMAKGNVVARDPGRTIRTGKLEVELGPAESSEGSDVIVAPTAERVTGRTNRRLVVSDDAASSTPPIAVAPADRRSKLGKLPAPTRVEHPKSLQKQPFGRTKRSVTTVTASDGVQIEVADPAVRTKSDRMTVDARTRRAELYGSDEQWARVVHETGFLEGSHLVIVDDKARTVHGLGPGRAWFIRPPEEDRPDGVVLKRPGRWNVTWRESMHYDDSQGHARFDGDVVVKRLTGNTRVRVEAKKLEIWFAAVSGKNQRGGSARQVKAVSARNDVVFLTEHFAINPGDDSDQAPKPALETAVRIAGHQLAYDNVDEQIHVIGEGTLLIRDKRKATSRPNRRSAARRSPQVRFVGRGDTVFSFKRQLMLDAGKNDVAMYDGVVMIHQPLDSNQTIQMDCGRLVANFEETGGMDHWLSGGARQPKIIAVHADENVFVSTGDGSVHSDHLNYDGARNVITLKADPRRMVELIQKDQPFTAKVFHWDLDKDQFSAERPGASLMPVR